MFQLTCFLISLDLDPQVFRKQDPDQNTAAGPPTSFKCQITHQVSYRAPYPWNFFPGSDHCTRIRSHHIILFFSCFFHLAFSLPCSLSRLEYVKRCVHGYGFYFTERSDVALRKAQQQQIYSNNENICPSVLGYVTYVVCPANREKNNLDPNLRFRCHISRFFSKTSKT